MNKPNVTRNKLVVIAREIGEATRDRDLSYRKIGAELNITQTRVMQVYAENKDKYSINSLMKSSKKVQSVKK